ncbi:MAG: hypothetical protein AB7S56_08760 [Halothiobacillaceae bacterium]
MNNIQNLADELLPTVQERERFWQWKHIKPLLFGLPKLLPALFFLGLWLSNQLGLLFAPESNRMSTQWLLLLIIYPLLLLWALAMLRLSKRLKQVSWIILAIGAFVLPLVIITLSPSPGLAVTGLFVLWLGVSWYWLPRTWSDVVHEWHGGFSPQVKALILSVMQHFESLANQAHIHFPVLVDRLLLDIRSIDDAITKKGGRDSKDFHGFLAKFGQHFLPVFAAINFREKAADLLPNTAWFNTQFSPVDKATQQRLNTLHRYYDNALQEDISQNLKMIWLKSGLLASEKRGKQNPDQLLDFHLVLLNQYLSDAHELHSDDFELSLYTVFRLAGSTDMNLFQQNSLAQIIEAIIRHAQQHSDWNAWTNNLKNAIDRYPNTLRHFQHRLIAIPEDRLESYHDTIMARNTRVRAALEALQQQQTTPLSSLQYLVQYISQLPESALAMFIRHASDAAMAIVLDSVDKSTQAAFWQACAAIIHIDKLQAIYAEHSESTVPSQAKQVAALQYLSRMLLSVESYERAARRKASDEAASNFINETDRYEYDIEKRLNAAVYLKMTDVEPALIAVLSELKQDIEQQHLKLEGFLQHLVRKFGKLIDASHQAQYQSVFAWFLQLPPSTTALSDEISENSLVRFIHAQTEFRKGFIEANPQRTFNALAGLLPQLLDHYPHDGELTHVCIVTSIELIATQTIASSDIDPVLELLAQAPETIFPKLHAETAETLSDIIQRAVVHFTLIESERLTHEQQQLAAKLVTLG